MLMRMEGDFAGSMLTIRTRYVPFGGKPEQLPRELWMEVVGPGLDAKDAMAKAFELATTVATCMTLAMNAAIEPLDVELCFDVSSHKSDHEFFKTSSRMKLAYLDSPEHLIKKLSRHSSTPC